MVKPDLSPFTTLLNEDGTLQPERGVVERRLSDMKEMFQKIPDSIGDPILYHVYLIPVPEKNSELQSSTTVLYPGTVGSEYYMTKGHFHEIRDRSEVYMGISGEGRLVMATEDGEVAVEPMRPGSINYVPGGWAHRSVNVGEEPLVFFATYVGDAGHDYGTIEEEGFPVLVVKGEEGPEVVENPRYTGRTR